MQRTRPALIIITLAIVAILIVGVVELNSRPDEEATPAETEQQQQEPAQPAPAEPVAVTPTNNNASTPTTTTPANTTQTPNTSENLPSTGAEIFVVPLAISVLIGTLLANSKAKKTLRERQLSI